MRPPELLRTFVLFLSVSVAAADLAPAQTASLTMFGKGCAGTDGTPVLSGKGLPALDKTFSLVLTSGRKGGTAVLVIGATDTNYKGLKLPFDLGLIGAKGCQLSVGFSVLLPLPLDANGEGSTFFYVPNNAALVGVKFFTQYYVVDPKANPLGVVTSNAAAAVVGK